MFSQIVKKIITIVTALPNNVKLIGGGNYIGWPSKIVNKGSIMMKGNVKLRPSCTLFCNVSPSFISFGKGVEIGNHSIISSCNHIVIEDDVLTGPHVFIADHNHKYSDPNIPIANQGVECPSSNEVVIGQGSWLGTNVVVVGNVRIGKHCVIGANSVVTRDIPDYSVAVGIPAKVIKKFNFTTHKWCSIK